MPTTTARPQASTIGGPVNSFGQFLFPINRKFRQKATEVLRFPPIFSQIESRQYAISQFGPEFRLTRGGAGEFYPDNRVLYTDRGQQKKERIE
jgi:hypothetical protein